MNAVLIVRLGALGDVVHAMPVVAALRARFPGARVDWLVDPAYVEVVKLVSGLTQAVPFDPRSLMVSDERAETVRTLGHLRGQSYDVVLDLQGLVKSAAAARLVGGGETIGFAREELREPAARVFYTKTVQVPASATHVIHKNLALLRALDIEAGAPMFNLSLPPSDAADRVARVAGGAGYAVLNPGAAWPNKRWPAERFGELAHAMRASLGLNSVVVWGPGEEALAESVVKASSAAATAAPPTTSVDLFSVMRGAKVAISGDTGPLHIATAVGTPVVALFGPTSPERNGPWRPDDVSVMPGGTCECPYERRCRRPSPCIDEIAAERVVSAVVARLGQPTHGANA